MQPFRFIHAADLHLDSPFRGVASLPEAIREAIRESTFAALQGMVDLAVSEQVDFLLIAGDVYDAAERTLRAQIRFQKAMERLAGEGIAVYVVHGNHDPRDGREARLRWPANVRFFSADKVESLVATNRRGVSLADIHGISYASSAVTDNLASRFRRADSPLYQIALLHANVDGDPAHDNYAPCSLRELKEKGFDYWALGHVHTRQVLCDSPYVVYPGNLQGRSVRETGEKGVYIAEVDERGETRLIFRALDAIRWVQEDLSIEGMRTEQELRDAIDRLVGEISRSAGRNGAVLRLKLKGRGPLYSLLRQGTALSELTEELRSEQAGLGERREPFVWLESVRNETAPEADRSGLMEQNSFLGDLLRLSDSLLADPEALEKFVASAVEPLLAQAKTAKLLQGGFNPEERRELLKAAEALAIDSLVVKAGWEE